jgi:hypothetical protein
VCLVFKFLGSLLIGQTAPAHRPELDLEPRENDGGHLGFRVVVCVCVCVFFYDVFHSGLFFVENGVFFRSERVALRVEEKNKQIKAPPRARAIGGAPLRPRRSTLPRSKSPGAPWRGITSRTKRRSDFCRLRKDLQLEIISCLSARDNCEPDSAPLPSIAIGYCSRALDPHRPPP